ncbi:DNA modification methylase [Sporomusaceae bacterium BoRhaA]|nr:DNA methyltransferase [Pelorhabdus rhamnosifermentans]MBU2703810.1 DNA modification methylase [Pelorhabdus rhamnosifermentans]
MSHLYVVFAGSGTTLVAAKNTGRQFIGIEKGKEYAAVAGERLGA